jgi:putative cell wall-binding protein
MRLRPRVLGLAALATSTCLLAGGTAPALAAPGDVDLKAASVQRVAGAGRVETAIAAAAFSGGKADAVVLARSDNFADSLAAAPLASDKSGPLLLTSPGALQSQVVDAIRDVLKPGGTVYLLGGTAALSASVESSVRATAGVGTVTRVQGGNRYETAVAVARLLPAATDVALVTGGNFPDGLAAGALMGVVDSSTNHSLGVVLLTNGATMPQATLDYVNATGFSSKGTVLAVGGQAVQASAAVAGATPVAGNSRYDTAAAVAKLFSSKQFFTDATQLVGVATGENWPDALAGSALLAYGGGPLVLTRGTSLPDASADALRTLQADARSAGGSVAQALVFGGSDVVSDAVAAQVGTALQ